MGGCVLCINLVVCIGAAWAQHRTNTETRTHMCRVTTPNNARGYRYRTWPSNNKLPGHQQSVRHCCSPGRIPPWKKKKKAQRKNSDCHTMAKVYNIIIYILALYGNKRLASTHTHTRRRRKNVRMWWVNGRCARTTTQNISPTAATVGPGGQEWKRPHSNRLSHFFPFFFFLMAQELISICSSSSSSSCCCIRLDAGSPPGQRLDQQEELLLFFFFRYFLEILF